jgi:hypothetical protein
VQRRFQQIVFSWLLVLAIGGHWPLLQSVAWVKMFVTFSQTDDLKTAVAKTFDGKHPCSICSLVKQGKETEQKQTAQVSKIKIDFFLVNAEPFLIQVPSLIETTFVVPAHDPQAASPLTPPPRHA